MGIMKAVLIVLLCLSRPVHGQVQGDEVYRPEVKFFVELSEAEVAEAAVGPLLRTPSGKEALDEIKKIEKLMLTVRWSGEQWTAFWGTFVGNATATGLKEFEKLTTADGYAPQVRMWMAMEHVRLMLLAYRPLETDPAKLEYIYRGFRIGSDLTKVLQDNVRQNPDWSEADSEKIHTLITGYKVVAYGKRASMAAPISETFTDTLLQNQQEKAIKDLEAFARKLEPPKPVVSRREDIPDTPPVEDATGKAIIKRVRRWWKDYRHNLENFVCERRIRSYDLSYGSESKLEQLDSLVGESHSQGALTPLASQAEVIDTIQVIKGKENYELKEGDEVTHKYTYGEFIGTLGRVLSRFWGELQWLDNGELRGRPVHILSSKTKLLKTFYFPRENGKVKKGPTLGFKGLLYVERGTGRVLRYLAREPLGVKKKHQVQDHAFILDYDDVTLDGKTAFLPVAMFDFSLYNNGSEVGNITRFSKCRTFRSETKLTFSE